MKFLILAISLILCSAQKSHAEDSLFDITAQGGYDYRMATYQISAMYWINPTNQIGVKGGANKSDGEHQTVFSLQYKHFLKNSFYISPEIYYLNTREKDSWWLTDNLFNLEAKYSEYVSMGAGVRIGNQWIIKHFTLGIDWIGLGRRFGTFRKDNQDTNEYTATLFNVYAGLSF